MNDEMKPTGGEQTQPEQAAKPARRKRAVQVKRRVVIRGIRTTGPLAPAPKSIIMPNGKIIVPGRRPV